RPHRRARPPARRAPRQQQPRAAPRPRGLLPMARQLGPFPGAGQPRHGRRPECRKGRPTGVTYGLQQPNGRTDPGRETALSQAHHPAKAPAPTTMIVRGAPGMSAALPDQDDGRHTKAVLHLIEVLQGLGVTVRFAPLTDAIGDWHSYTQTAVVKANAHPGNQAWFLAHLLAFLAAGPAGSPAAMKQRSLRLVVD